MQKQGKHTKTDVKRGVFDIVDALQAPIISYPSPWNADMPERVLQDIPAGRLVALAKGEQLATIPECVAYIMPACLEFPLNSDWAEIFLYVCTMYLKDFRHMEVPNDIKVDELDDHRTSMLNKLRRFLYDRRRKHLKEVRKSINDKLSRDSRVIQGS